MRLADKVAIITGGANGIGKETAMLFAKQGAKVVIADFDVENGKAVENQLREKEHDAFFIQVDVANKQSVEQMVSQTIAAYEKIDILINNAGITQDNLLKNLTDDQWQRVIDVNLTGVFFCTTAVVPHMIERGKGKIIITSSISGVYGNVGQTNYAASKAGVIGMTKTWAKELGRNGIRVNAVAPGFIQTDMVEKVPEKVLEQMINKIPLQCLGEPSDIANAFLYLASDEANYVNGTVLHVDGGLVL